MRWMKQHKIIAILLAIILISLCVLVASVVAGGAGNPVSSFAGRIFSAVERPISGVAGRLSDQISGLFSYQTLQEENAALEEENESLRQQLAAMTLSANELKELRELSEELNYQGADRSWDLISCDVASMDGANWMNLFTIDAGAERGIEEGDVVICGDGLVGRIQSVGKGWSRVISLIDESSKVTFKVSGNLRLIGVLDGCRDNILSGYMLDKNAKVEEGDRLVTSGMGYFPAGIEIGRITKVRYDSDTQLQRVDVRPSVDFLSLQKVSVIL